MERPSTKSRRTKLYQPLFLDESWTFSVTVVDVKKHGQSVQHKLQLKKREKDVDIRIIVHAANKHVFTEGV